MPIQHVRKMLPPKREKIEVLTPELIVPPVEDVYERDPKAGVLIRVGKTDPGAVLVWTPTGKRAESFETIDEDNKVVVHEGSMVAQDTACHDCGAGLKPGNRTSDHDFYFLICGRIDDRDLSLVKASPVDENGNPRTHVRLDPDEMAEPYENCVLECGRVGLPGKAA